MAVCSMIKKGEITCVANDGSSVVDYILDSTSFFESVLYFHVGSDDFSDHFPLHCQLSLFTRFYR